MFELLCSEIQEKTSNFCCVISHNVAKQIVAKLSFLIKSHLNIETNYTNIFLFQFFIRGMDADQVQSNSSIKLISALNYETTCTTIVLTVAPYFHSQSQDHINLKTKTTFNEQLLCRKYRIRHKQKEDVTQVNATEQFLPTTSKPHTQRKTLLSFTYHYRMKRRFKKLSTAHDQSQLKNHGFA